MVRSTDKVRNQWTTFFSGWRTNAGVRFLLFFLLAALFYAVTAGHVITQTFSLAPGDASPRDIRSPERILDETATEQAKQRASGRVEAVYSIVPLNNLQLVDRILDKMRQLNADDQVTAAEKANVYRMFFEREYRDFVADPISGASDFEQAMPALRERITERLQDTGYRIPEEVYFKLTRLTQQQIQEMEPVVRGIVRRTMDEPVNDAAQARTRVSEDVNASSLSSQLARELALEIARFAVTPNRFLDEAATEQAKTDAENRVQPIFIEKNELIVSKGERLSESHYRILSELGLLKEEPTYWPQLGLLVLIVLLVLLVFLFVQQSNLALKDNNAQLLMLILIFALTVASMKIVALGHNVNYSHMGYLAPVALGSMLITILLDSRLAFMSSVIFAVLSSIVFNVAHPDQVFDFHYGFVALVVCFSSIFAIHRASQRSTVLKAGMMVSIFSAVTIMALILLKGEYHIVDILLAVASGMAGGLLTAVLVIGLLPFFEVSFGILSPLKLVELSNPNHPLLRKLLTETPGSYHHSVMVGNLSEAAAEAIGADGLLCRVGSFYHDIGKTKRPAYFIENQVNMENPHDRIEPELSKSIIIAHAADGVEMLKEYKMPKQICDIAAQHHGTTLLKYFYHKATKAAEQQQQTGATNKVEEAEYRYPGPKAQSKEAAIVGIADCVEAAVRSLRNPTIEQIGTMVDKIIKDRLDDNQFNECDLTLKELDVIGHTFKETLLGIFHSRIEYPELKPKQTETQTSPLRSVTESGKPADSEIEPVSARPVVAAAKNGEKDLNA